MLSILQFRFGFGLLGCFFSEAHLMKGAPVFHLAFVGVPFPKHDEDAVGQET